MNDRLALKRTRQRSFAFFFLVLLFIFDLKVKSEREGEKEKKRKEGEIRSSLFLRYCIGQLAMASLRAHTTTTTTIYNQIHQR